MTRPFFTTGNSAAYKKQTPGLQIFRQPYGILIIGIAAINNYIAFFEVWDEISAAWTTQSPVAVAISAGVAVD